MKHAPTLSGKTPESTDTTHTEHNIRCIPSVSTDLTLYMLNTTIQHLVKI